MADVSKVILKLSSRIFPVASGLFEALEKIIVRIPDFSAMLNTFNPCMVRTCRTANAG